MTLSTFSLHSRDTTCWSIPFFIAFVLIPCSCTAHIRLSVSRFSSPAFSLFYLLSSCIPSLFLSGIDHSMISPSMLPASHSLVVLHCLIQSLSLVATLRLSLFVVVCSIIKDVWYFQFNTVFDTQQPSTSLSSWHVQTTSQQKSMTGNLYPYQ